MNRDIDLWQVPLLVGAAIVMLVGAAYLVERRWPRIVDYILRRRKRLRFAGLAVLSVVLLPLVWVAIQAADTSVLAGFTAVGTLVVEVANLWFAVLSYREVKKARTGG